MGLLDLLSNWSSLPLLALTGLLTLLFYRRFLSPLRHFPGPFAASLTRLWHVRNIARGDQNLELIRQHEKHGHFVRVSYDEISCTHPDAVKKILLAPVNKSNWYKIHALPDYRFQSPMSTTDYREKVNKSKCFAPAYAVTHVLQSEEHIDGTFSRFLDWMDTYATSSSSPKPMNLNDFISYVTFDVIGQIVFSKPFGFLASGTDIGSTVKNSVGLNVFVAIMGYFRWLFVALLANPVITYLAILPMGHLFETTKRVLAEREHNPDSRFDAVSFWFRYQKEHPDRVTTREINTQALAAVGAGSDTVACGMQAFVYYMMRHPTAWQRAREEIYEARREGRCRDRVVSWADAQKLPYTQACIKEALRVFSPVPMGLTRVAPKGGLTIGDRTIPEGFLVSVSPWAIHHSRDIWGDDAHEFDPDRWLRGDAAAKEKYWIPFGAGYGSCPGQNVAKIEIGKMAPTLVRDYDIEQVDKSQDWQWKAYFTVVPHSWPVYIKKRATDM